MKMTEDHVVALNALLTAAQQESIHYVWMPYTESIDCLATNGEVVSNVKTSLAFFVEARMILARDYVH